MNGTHLEASQMKECGSSFQVSKRDCLKTHPKRDIDLQGNDDHISPSPFGIFKGMSFPTKDMDSFPLRVFGKSLVTSLSTDPSFRIWGFPKIGLSQNGW